MVPGGRSGRRSGDDGEGVPDELLVDAHGDFVGSAEMHDEVIQGEIVEHTSRLAETLAERYLVDDAGL